MTRHEPRGDQAVRAAHQCPVRDCQVGCSPGHVVCVEHWKRIPTPQRQPLRAAFRNRTADPLGFYDAVAITGRLADLHAEATS